MQSLPSLESGHEVAQVEAIRREHEAAQTAFRTAVDHAIRCGELLAQAKAQLPHGAFLPWVDKHFPASRRTAQGYMRLARAEDAQALAHLGIEGALREIAAPRHERDLLDELQSRLPDLVGDEWDAFLASVDRFGVLIPVVRDQHGRIIDGRQRVRAAKQLGIDYRVDVVRVESTYQAALLAYSLNVIRGHEGREDHESVGLLRDLAGLEAQASEIAR